MSTNRRKTVKAKPKPAPRAAKNRTLTRDEQAEVIVMYTLCGSYAETARRCAVDDETVKRIVTRGAKIPVVERVVKREAKLSELLHDLLIDVCKRSPNCVPYQNIEQYVTSVEKLVKLMLLVKGQFTELTGQMNVNLNSGGGTGGPDVKIDVNNSAHRRALSQLAKSIDLLTGGTDVIYPPQPGEPDYSPEVPMSFESITARAAAKQMVLDAQKQSLTEGTA